MNIIITGASKGIGKAIATAFAQEGAQLFICARNEQSLNETALFLSKTHPSCTIHSQAFDVSIKEEAIAFGNWVLSKTNQIDILINNAGHYLPGNVYDEADGTLEKMLAINLLSAYHLTRKLLPTMISAQKGHIFNLCSIASLQAYNNGGSYSISKFALLGFSKNLREELKQYHIKVTAVLPGAVMTDSWGDFDNSSNRIMEANDIAKMVLAASKLSAQAVVEDIVLRPVLGDL
jgi:short-subunit dehydrogenase